MRAKVTPKFNVAEIMKDTIEKDWMLFQNEAFEMGKKLTSYMQSYVNSNRHREGGTGNLAKAIKFYGKTGAGFISWGIGKISYLTTKVPYWYVVNYGFMTTGERFIPKGGLGYFNGGRAPDSSLIGSGTERWHGTETEATLGENFGFYLKPKTPVRPINYIQATQHQLGAEFKQLLAKLRGSK